MLRALFRRKSRIRRIVTVAIIAITVLGITFEVFLVPGQNQGQVAQKPSQQTTASTDFGITYLPLTPGVSAYYELGVDSGALVTHVVTDSLADKAGLKAGDIIVGYNGTAVEKGNSLLGIVRRCPVGAVVVMEVFRGEYIQTFSFVHIQN